jgi:hypothetical protein
MDDSTLVVVLGGIFAALGVVFVLWGLKERRSYLDSLTQRQDMREFLTHWPERWWLNTLTIGGWISVAVGVVLLILGFAFWLAK